MMTGLPVGLDRRVFEDAIGGWSGHWHSRASHRCVCDTSQTGDVTGLAQRLAELDSFAVRHLDNGGVAVGVRFRQVWAHSVKSWGGEMVVGWGQ